MLFQVTISKMSRNLKSHIQIDKSWLIQNIFRITIVYIGLQHPLLYFITKYISSNIPTHKVFWDLKRHLSNALCAAAVLDACIECKNSLFLNGKMAIALIKKGRLLLVSMRTITALSYKRCIHRRPYCSPLQFSPSKMKTDFLILYHIRISIQVRVAFDDDRITINITHS